MVYKDIILAKVKVLGPNIVGQNRGVPPLGFWWNF